MHIEKFLFSNDSIAFSTRDYAHQTNISLSAATHRLRRLANSQLTIQLSRGIWANTNNPYFSNLSCVPKLSRLEEFQLLDEVNSPISIKKAIKICANILF